MFCPKCGAENADGQVLCSRCSWVLSSTATGGYNEDAKTSGVAIASLVLGIMGFFTCGLTFLPAIICGIIAIVKIGNANGAVKGKSYAITGIVLPVVYIPVFSMLLAILMPTLGRSKTLAIRLVCGTNLQTLSTGMMVYSFDYDGQFPTQSEWCDLLIDEAEVYPKSFYCPATDAEEIHECYYVMNENIVDGCTEYPMDMVLLFETDHPGWNMVGGQEMLSAANHQQEGCNVSFVDGHVEFVRTEGFPSLKWTSEDDGCFSSIVGTNGTSDGSNG